MDLLRRVTVGWLVGDGPDGAATEEPVDGDWSEGKRVTVSADGATKGPLCGGAAREDLADNGCTCCCKVPSRSLTSANPALLPRRAEDGRTFDTPSIEDVRMTAPPVVWRDNPGTGTDDAPDTLDEFVESPFVWRGGAL